MIEYGDKGWDDPVTAYMDIAGKRHIEIYKLIFDHGIETLITPVIGPEILATRDAYMQKIGGEGLARLATHPDVLSFYKEDGVRVRFYGEYHTHLSGTPYEYLSSQFDGLTKTTSGNNRFRLFFGAFADNLNATKVVVELAMKYYQEQGTLPTRERIVEMYYGEYVEKADIFIGFDRFTAFDYPLLNSGEEDLYFTVAPSLYMNEEQLRSILYDHVFSRRTQEPEYNDLSSEELQSLKKYYHFSRASVMGIGLVQNGIWVPVETFHLLKM